MSVRHVLRCSTAGLAGVLGLATPAGVVAQERLSVDASLGGGVASNPFLQTGDTPTTGSATVSIAPRYTLRAGPTTATIDGSAVLTKYFSRYRDSDSFNASAAVTHQYSDRTQIGARLGYTNSIVGAFNDPGIIGVGTIVPVPGGVVPGVPATDVAGGVPATPLTPVVPIASPDLTIDPTLGGIGRRRQSYLVGADATTRLTDRDSLSYALAASALRSGGGLSAFNYVTQQVGYSRAVSARLSLFGNVAVGIVDYLNSRSDTHSVMPGVGFTYLAAEGISLRASAGASVVRSDLPVTGSATTTQFSGQASLCQQDSRFNACVAISRAALPSLVQGVRNQTSASLTASARLGERDTLSLATSYSRAGGVLIADAVTAAPLSSRSEFLTVRGDYSRRLSPRLSAFVGGSAARVYERPALARAPSYEARIGLRVRFGAIN